MSFIKPEEFSINLGLSRNTIRGQIHAYKNRYNKNPRWYIENGIRGEAKIDTDLYLKDMNICLEVSRYAADKLYYIFKALSFSNSDLARLMIKKSIYYKSMDTWNVFFSTSLFTTKTNLQYLKISMITEFIRIGTKHLYLLRKYNRLDLSKEKDYYLI